MSESLPVAIGQETPQLALLVSRLATASTCTEAALVAKQAKVLLDLAKSIGRHGRAINTVAKLRMEAMAKAGELLATTVRRGGSKFRAGTLPAGIDKKHSHRWQAIARIPVADRERYFAMCDEADEEITTAGLLREAKQHQRRLKIEVQIEALGREALELPSGPFRVIVADPPWHYDLREDDPSHRATLPYPSMTIDAIKAMGVCDIAAKDSVLWLWTTNAHLREAFEVVDAWGFNYKTTLTWVKSRMGIGSWLRGQTEHCLFAARGNPTVNLTSQTTVLHGPVRAHSQKPDEFYEMVETLCPGNRVDVFARTRRPGWATFGDEVPR